MLQKAQQRLKLPVAPSLERLQIYRWAHQALATPPDHPLLPLVWQRFLQLYLRQPGPEYGYVSELCTHVHACKQGNNVASSLSDLKVGSQAQIRLGANGCSALCCWSDWGLCGLCPPPLLRV